MRNPETSYNFTQNVEGKKTGFIDDPKQAELLQKEIEKFLLEGQQFLDQRKNLFTTFAKDVSLRFKFSNAFYIDLERGEVNLDASWFFRKGFSKEQIQWAVMHELSHFKDLVQDPEGMEANVVHIVDEARLVGKKIFEKIKDAFGQDDPEYIERLKKLAPVYKDHKLNSAEQAGFKIWFTFYNVLHDIYVNNIVSRTASRYEASRPGGKEIRKLYREQLFPGIDYTKLPRHMQFMYALLRGEMVPDEELELSYEVEEALARKTSFQGAKYNARQIIESFIKPKRGRDTRVVQRQRVLAQTLEPIFTELLMKDLEEWDPTKQNQEPQNKGEPGESEEEQSGEESSEQQSGEGKSEDQDESQSGEQEQNQSGSTNEEDGDDEQEQPSQGSQSQQQTGDANPFKEYYDEFEQEQSPDQIDENQMTEWADKRREEQELKQNEQTQQKEERDKTLEEKAREAQAVLDKEWAEKHAVSYESLQEYKSLERTVEPFLEELAVLWRSIVYGSSSAITRGKVGHFKTGVDLDVQEAIRQWPQIAKGRLDDVRVMDRMEAKEGLVKHPEVIRVRFLADVSGSMFDDETGKKLKTLKETMVLLMSSFNEFNMHLNRSRQQTKSKLKVETEIWLFGGYALKVKSFDSQNDIVGVIRALEKINGLNENYEDVKVKKATDYDQILKSTADHEALEQVNNSITPGEEQRISQGKVMDITFEVTDGEPDKSELTKQEIEKLHKRGEILRAFQIGGVYSSGRYVFNDVWNNTILDEDLGEYVGTELKNLTPAIVKSLKKYLKDVKL
jgi:hypothetical protein